MSQDRSANRGRETMLAVALTIMAVGGFAFFFTLISGGWFVYFVLVLLAMIGFGGFHYLLWGRLMMQETAAEREEAELAAKAEIKDWDLPDPERSRHS